MAERMGYLLPGGVTDNQRAAKWFVEWWRNSSADGPQGGTPDWGWGMDFQWNQEEGVDTDTGSSESVFAETVLAQESNAQLAALPTEGASYGLKQSEPSTETSSNSSIPETASGRAIEQKFEEVIVRYFERLKARGQEMSQTQTQKLEKEEKKKTRMEKRDEVGRWRVAGQKRRGDRKIEDR
jgi:methionine-rich copper-binding protein CopC